MNLDNINSNKEKDQQKPDKDRSPIFQQILDSNEEDKKIINILNPNNNILNDNYMNEKIINDSNDIKNKIINQKSKLEIKSNISNNYDNNNDTNQKNPESINIFIIILTIYIKFPKWDNIFFFFLYYNNILIK